MLKKLGSMLRIRDRRIQIVLGVAMLVVIGAAAYQIVMAVRARRHYDAACEALERFEFEQASTHLNSYLSLRPADPFVLMMAAQTARRRGDLVEAYRQLRLAEQHGAPAPGLVMERKLLRIQKGDLSDVGRLLEICRDRPDAPETAIVLEAIIEGCLMAGNLPEASRAIDLWLEHRPGKIDQAQGLYWRGRVGNRRQAQADFEQALELVPDHFLARLWLVEQLILLEAKQAIPHLEIMRRQRPNDPTIGFQEARVYRILGKTEEAAALLDQLLASTPTSVPALVERGGVAMEMHHLQEAEKLLRDALALAPTDRQVNQALAECLRQSGRADDAKPFQEKVREIDMRKEKMTEELKKLKGGP